MMKCSGCSGEQRGLLHHVRHRGDHRQYCTCCVLKNHPGSFCFNCFDVFEGPPPSDSIKCSNCPSLSHSTCATASAGGSTSSSSSRSSLLLCPTCSNPSFLFFKASPILDLASAKVLLAASTIASQSMRKAAAAAKLDADRKVREAAFARKRAREALEKTSVALLMPPPASAPAAAKGKHQINNNKLSSIAAVAAASASLTSAEQRRNVTADVKMKAGSITTPSPAATAATSHKRLPKTSMMPPPTQKEKEEKLQSSTTPPIVQPQRLPRAHIAVKEPKVAASELVGNDNVSTTARPTINTKDDSDSKAKSGIVLTGT